MKTLKLMSRALLVMAMMSTSCTKQTITESDKKVVILGDSNVRRIIFYSSWGAELGMNDVVSLGFDGYASSNLIYTGNPTPLAQAIAEDPDIVYLSVGGNDVFGKVAPEVIMANIKIICDSLIAEGIPVVVTSILSQIKSRNDFYKNQSPSYDFNAKFLEANAALLQLCVDNGYEMMDTRPYLCVRDSANIWELADEFSSDGIHLNLDGYQQWVIPLSYSINQH